MRELARQTLAAVGLDAVRESFEKITILDYPTVTQMTRISRQTIPKLMATVKTSEGKRGVTLWEVNRHIAAQTVPAENAEKRRGVLV